MTNDGKSDGGLPPNKFNAHAWIVGAPEIGEGTWIGAFTLIDGLGGLRIGKGCDIANGAQILSHSTVKRCVSERRYPSIESKPTLIEDYVFVGANAVVQMGSRVGHHSVIAAGAVVLEDTEIPAYSLVAGVPARIVRDIRDEIDNMSIAAEGQ